jgi:UDP-glucuronate decarboxylase
LGLNKKILVTGGAGFVGSNLVKYLLERGDEVIVLDSFFTGRMVNLEKLKSLYPSRLDIVRQDVVTPFEIESDQIFHLACPASPPHYQFDPIHTLKTSVLGSLNVYELAKRTKARVLIASTSEVYGDPLEHPQKETYWGHVNPIGIRSCYDEGKRVAETLAMDFYRQYHVDVRIIRIFNTYGPAMRADDGRVVSNFIVQALKGSPLTIYGDGSQTRSFCFVDDLVSGIVKMMDRPFEKGQAFLGPVNLGNPGEFTMKELAETILRLTGSKSKITYLPLPSDDPKMRRPDITLAKEKLNWEPKVVLEEGLKKTIPYFENEIKG